MKDASPRPRTQDDAQSGVSPRAQQPTAVAVEMKFSRYADRNASRQGHWKSRHKRDTALRFDGAPRGTR